MEYKKNESNNITFIAILSLESSSFVKIYTKKYFLTLLRYLSVSFRPVILQKYEHFNVLYVQ